MIIAVLEHLDVKDKPILKHQKLILMKLFPQEITNNEIDLLASLLCKLLRKAGQTPHLN